MSEFKRNHRDTETKEFECKCCYTRFKAVGYDNPVFLADIVADCPKCGSKCWEVMISITKTEYKRLNKIKGVKVHPFN
jgi:Zn finger protein HypA/HybF involved in hydrogenase expression